MVSHRACSEAVTCAVHYRREAGVDVEGFVNFEAFPINVQNKTFFAVYDPAKSAIVSNKQVSCTTRNKEIVHIKEAFSCELY